MPTFDFAVQAVLDCFDDDRPFRGKPLREHIEMELDFLIMGIEEDWKLHDEMIRRRAEIEKETNR